MMPEVSWIYMDMGKLAQGLWFTLVCKDYCVTNLSPKNKERKIALDSELQPLSTSP